MRSLTKVLGMVGVAAFAVGMVVPAQAATAASTYHGTFNQVQYVSCVTEPSTPSVTGVWNVTILKGETATFTVNLLLDGKHHVSYGIPSKYLPLTDRSGAVFSFQFDTPAGALEVYLANGNLTYHFPNGYNYSGLSCADVFYTGPMNG